MADLRDQLKDVEPDSSPDSFDPAPVMPDPSIKDGDGGTDGDRDWKQVRGELLRKQEKATAEVTAKLDQLTKQFMEFVSSHKTGASPSAESAKTKTSVEDYTASELEQLLPSIPEESRPQVQSIIQQKRTDERIETQLRAFTEERRKDDERKRYNNKALERFPDLRDFSSDFARMVDAEIQQLPEHIVRGNPRIVLDIANDVAISRGIQPNTRGSMPKVTRPASGRTGPSGNESTNEGTMSDAEREAIGKRLQHNLKGKKFDMERIKEREQFNKGRFVHIKREEE